jgi:DNA-directed RNA polymerase subunit L
MENIKLSLNGFRLDGELKNVPVAFPNALRRILLAEIPTVVISNVQILENTTQLTHEMIRHRVEMLPINVRPEEAPVLRDTRIKLEVRPSPESRDVFSTDFVIEGPRDDILLRDRDLGEPLYFMTVKPTEAIHIRATLSIVTSGASQVSISTFKNHIDPTLAESNRATWVAEGNDPRVFDTFQIQRSYHRNPETQRPDWFDFTVESIGVIPAKDLVRKAVEVLQAKIQEWIKNPILREEAGWFRIESIGETYTLGQLIQELMYGGGLVEFVSRDIGHPLLPKLVIRFQTKTVQPEAVVQRFKEEALALCESILKSV